jgi:uncharacterized protein YydD (DUF2326 family)
VLRSLTSTLPDGKEAAFLPGVNIALAIRTKQAKSKDSRNAVGKSSFVSVIDFCLGSSAGTNHILRRPELADHEFRLELDLADEARHVIARSGAAPTRPILDGFPLGLDALRSILGTGLFGVDDVSSDPSYRSLIAYYLRGEAAGGFSDPLRTVSRQSDLATQPPLAYLFGLDLGLVARATEIADSRRNVSALRKATRDPIMGRTLGNAADLDAEIATLQVRRSALETELRSFRVVERYAELRSRADDLSQQIRAQNDRAVVAEHRARGFAVAMDTEEEAQPDHSYLESVFEQVGITFPDLARKRFDEVAAFHASVVRNRRLYLAGERESAEQEVREAQSMVAQLDAERAQVMRVLSEGGALETFQDLQQTVGEVAGRLVELERRRNAVEVLRGAQAHLNRQALALQDTVHADLIERREQVAEISSMFTRFAFAIYGSKRPATLAIQERETGYALTPTIGGDKSAGVRSMSIFCFDLTMAVIAKRSGRGPNFLIHDSHLYDAVEARQVGDALALASRVCAEEGMQYVATINSDALDIALQDVPELEYHRCLTLSDEYESGGYFGLRFN